MEEQFVPYELAVKLKELGFAEICFAHYSPFGGKMKLQLFSSQEIYNGSSKNIYGDGVLAPLWQQAFDWFREIRNLYYGIHNDGTYNSWYISRWGRRYSSYEEARQDHLEKLIELCKKH